MLTPDYVWGLGWYNWHKGGTLSLKKLIIELLEKRNVKNGKQTQALLWPLLTVVVGMGWVYIWWLHRIPGGMTFRF